LAHDTYILVYIFLPNMHSDIEEVAMRYFIDDLFCSW